MSATDADVLMVDGIDSIETLKQVRNCTDKPLLFNQIAGGKSPNLSIEQLRAHGIGLVQYSTPLLFTAQQAMTEALEALVKSGGILPRNPNGLSVGVAECLALLQANVKTSGGAEPTQ